MIRIEHTNEYARKIILTEYNKYVDKEVDHIMHYLYKDTLNLLKILVDMKGKFKSTDYSNDVYFTYNEYTSSLEKEVLPKKQFCETLFLSEDNRIELIEKLREDYK